MYLIYDNPLTGKYKIRLVFRKMLDMKKASKVFNNFQPVCIQVSYQGDDNGDEFDDSTKDFECLWFGFDDDEEEVEETSKSTVERPVFERPKQSDDHWRIGHQPFVATLQISKIKVCFVNNEIKIYFLTFFWKQKEIFKVGGLDVETNRDRERP